MINGTIMFHEFYIFVLCEKEDQEDSAKRLAPDVPEIPVLDKGYVAYVMQQICGLGEKRKKIKPITIN